MYPDAHEIIDLSETDAEIARECVLSGDLDNIQFVHQCKKLFPGIVNLLLNHDAHEIDK